MKTLLWLILCFASAIVCGQDVSTHINEGIKHHDNGEYDLAIGSYREALKIDPKNPTALYEIAYSYYVKKEFQDALKQIDEAITHSTTDLKPMALVTKGSILDEMGRGKDALKTYEEALKEFPDNYLLWYNNGVTLAKLKRFDEAEKAYMAALTKRFSHAGSHLQLGNLKRIANQKAPAALSYYFFLLLENNTARSQQVIIKLREMIYGDLADSTKNDKTIYINPALLGGKNGTSTLGAAELYFAMMGAAGDEVDKKTGTKKTAQQRFYSDTYSFFQVLKELQDNEAKAAKKKKKQKGQAEPDFFLNHYALFFAEMNQADQTEAFCYHIMKSLSEPEVEAWTTANEEKMERFYIWLKSR